MTEPDDRPTLRASDVQRLRTKLPLPRSPLFRTQITSTSPERILTSSLSPRLPSHGTPGVLFSQHARRRRSYRPRTISYSYVESERASLAHDDEQLPKVEGFPDGKLASLPRNLQEELRGSSLQSSIFRYGNTYWGPMQSSTDNFSSQAVSFDGGSYSEGNVRYSPAAFNPEQRSTSLTLLTHRPSPKDKRCFSSPELPPPFSAISRRASSPISILDRSVGTLGQSPSQSTVTGTSSTSLSASPYVSTMERYQSAHCLMWNS